MKDTPKDASEGSSVSREDPNAIVRISLLCGMNKSILSVSLYSGNSLPHILVICSSLLYLVESYF